ncbi:unnamed protein product, partial [Symbiodinium sp. KB8]
MARSDPSSVAEARARSKAAPSPVPRRSLAHSPATRVVQHDLLLRPGPSPLTGAASRRAAALTFPGTGDADLEHGLDEKAIETLRDQYGPNELEDDEQNILLKFLSYFWGPMPIMIWVAIIIEIIKTILNGVVGFIEENNAGNAIAALKDKLAPECKVLRTVGGAVKREKIKSRELVPGDVVELKLGDVVPADCMLVGDPRKETDQLQVDQSALTG